MLNVSCENNKEEEKLSLDEVKTEFKTLKPEATNTEWDTYNKFYHVDYTNAKGEKDFMIYHQNGNMFKERNNFVDDELPLEIEEYISLNYNDYVMVNAESYEESSIIIFLVNLQGPDKIKTLVFNSDAELLREIVTEEKSISQKLKEALPEELVNIDYSELPANIQDSIEANFNRIDLVDINKMISEDSVITYKVDFKGEDGDFSVQYDAQANVIPIKVVDE